MNHLANSVLLVQLKINQWWLSYQKK